MGTGATHGGEGTVAWAPWQGHWGKGKGVSALDRGKYTGAIANGEGHTSWGKGIAVMSQKQGAWDKSTEAREEWQEHRSKRTVAGRRQ